MIMKTLSFEKMEQVNGGSWWSSIIDGICAGVGLGSFVSGLVGVALGPVTTAVVGGCLIYEIAQNL